MDFGFDDVDIPSLLRRRSLKWAKGGAGVLGAWVAEMDFNLAPAVRAALHDAVERGETGYPLRDARTGLPEACADWLRSAFGWRVDPAAVFTVPDALRGLAVGIEYFGELAAPVIVPTPAYPPFFEVVKCSRRPLVQVPMILGSDDRPRLDLDTIDSVLSRRGGTVVLCNPHNPLGLVHDRTELHALSEVVDRRGGRVIADELHAPLLYPGPPHIPYATVSSAASAHSLTLVSASKAWNVQGLKCCQVILNGPKDVAHWREIPFHARHGASSLGIVATVAAYRDGDPWRRQLIDYLDGNRALVDEAVRTRLPGVTWRRPDATYLAWLDFRELDLDDPAAYLLREARIALSDGALFGQEGRGFARLNFATSRHLLRRILSAMETAVQCAGAHARSIS